ncbi:MAG: hypothetical protein O3C04_02825 [Crenarchaeota archaeon]|nr:hypothetical protein [Thermoproteota archaeon]MDA1124562.1 hypothetical protein [Thermoproteota archaeon]
MLKQFFKSKNKLQTPSIGSNSQIVSQLHALEIEKDILTKTIVRLYQNETDLTEIQKDRLLLKYQHQLGVVITRIEKLENASKHPDLGPLGDGLIALMDQKLSQLDQRLYELTSKIQVAQTENDVHTKKNNKKVNEIEIKSKAIFEKPIEEYVNKSSEKFEITTLTLLQKLDPVKQSKYNEMLSQLSSGVITPPMKLKILEEQKTETVGTREQNIMSIIENKPELIVELPEEDLDDDDDDDLNKIKTKIMATMSKIEQAEVD